MAFPWLFSEGFEAGTLGSFTSESDTDSKLSFKHYRELAKITTKLAKVEIPYRGAYCMYIDLSGGTGDAYVEETTEFDTSMAGTIYVRLFLFLGSDLVMAASDRFTIFALQSAGPVSEVELNIRNLAGVIQLLASETHNASTVSAATLTQDVWHCVEVKAVIDNDASNDGTIDWWLDGVAQTQIASLNQAAISQARFGAMNIDAGTTAGTLMFDEIVADNARIYPLDERFPSDNVHFITHNQHVAIGAGQATVAVTGTAGDAILTMYDTENGNSEITPEPIAYVSSISNTAVNELANAVVFSKGLYVTMSGTAVQGFITVIDTTANDRGQRVQRAFLHG